MSTAVGQYGFPAAGGGAVRRSESTKARILAAARKHFAAYGYERTTIRAIAGEAGIDPALVMRYFGNKEKLFAAAAEFDLRLPDLTALLRAAVSHQVAVARMRAIFATQVMPAVAPLCKDRATAATRVGLVATQMLGMALCRYVLRLPPVVALDRAAVIRWLAPTIQRYLTAGP